MAAIPNGADSLLLLTWHSTTDNLIWYSTRYVYIHVPPDTGPPASGWSPPKAAISCTDSPGLAQLGNLAFQGPPGPQQAHLFEAQYSDQNGIRPGTTPVAGPGGPFLTTTRPALGGYYGLSPVLAWRRQVDGAAVASFKQANGWGSEIKVGLTSHAPALSADGQILVWKGVEGDDQIYGSARNGSGWGAQQPLIPAAGSMITNEAPALTWTRSGAPGRYVMAWRNPDYNGQLYWSTSSGHGWSDASAAVPENGAMWTSHGPAIYSWAGGLTMVWKGSGGDTRLWWSDYTAATGKWVTPSPIAGALSNSGPALGGVVALFG